ncbi:hypothetical protein PTI98_006657 [Pleurotus ostreatus]|nr:hypothetical protein PTI98_006657 [Pleurotus ostreatus]
MADIASTYGALLIGGIIAALLSGAVTVQCIVYFNCYPADPLRIKLLVFTVWLIDFFHIFCVSASEWYYLIMKFGDSTKIDYIPWSLAVRQHLLLPDTDFLASSLLQFSIASTAALTFLVHCFFVHRLFKLSERNWYITVPMGVLALLRVAFACLTTSKMIIFKSISQFIREFRWSFTLGLALSCALDIIITASLCYFLLRNRKQTSSMNHVIDSLMLYAFENGSLTCAATVMSMICWLTMPSNLVFMGIHFFISKLYANSLLATLNTRNHLKKGPRDAEEEFPAYADQLRSIHRKNTLNRTRGLPVRNSMLRINVEKTVECTVTFEGEEGPSTPSTLCHYVSAPPSPTPTQEFYKDMGH